ncbi:MAG: TatD family hydrolase [Opitutaceae bacterium]|nr:TatD family hydrolase [Opitutaceae bacterium]
MGLIDTHTHLESFQRKGELPAVLTRAREAGVEAMITIGTSTDDWALYRETAEALAGFVHYTVGLHPCAVEEDWPAQVAQMEAFWTAAGRLRPVALGEVGLDRFHLPKDPTEAARVFALQCAAFDAGLEMARRLEVPVVIHSRGAFRECVERIDASGVAWHRVIFHCFVEGAEEMRMLMSRGGWGSFTGVLTYKSADAVREAARVQGLERFLLETDAPYLTPVPHRGKPNEPGYVALTAAYAASVFGVKLDEVVRVSTRNARHVFGLT